MDLPTNYDLLSQSQRREVREQYIHLQNGLCYFCKKRLDKKPPSKILLYKINKKLFPGDFFKYPIHLHHDHDTGMTIGAVHCYCNAVLWQYFEE